VRDPDSYDYDGITQEAGRQRWINALRGAFRGDAFLFVDKPPVENPAAEASAPLQLAMRMIELFDKAEEEILIISAYLIPTIDLEGAVERAVQRGVDVRILTNSFARTITLPPIVHIENTSMNYWQTVHNCTRSG
jgi:putative cardiolipin synthase